MPRPTLAFVGRQAELARILEAGRDEVLFLIYGVAGVGKTEFAYRGVAALREQLGWDHEATLAVEVPAGTDAAGVVALLRAATGARRISESDGAGSLVAELESIARALNARPRLVLIDDIHHLDPGSAGMLIGWLARHVWASRVFVTSRFEIPIEVDGVTPLVLQLGPLDDDEARQMLRFLAARRDLAITDVDRWVHQAGGSPDQLRHVVNSPCRSANLGACLGGRLERALSELPAEDFALLARIAVRGCLSSDPLAGGEPQLVALRRLVWQFFLEVSGDELVVPALVRTAVLRITAASDASPGPSSLAEHHGDGASEQPMARAAADPVPARAPSGGPRTRIVVDEQRGAIAGPRAHVTGRYRLCAILLFLLDGHGEPVSAEQLYMHVWKSEIYHPMRHRGTLYSAVNRLRQTLIEVCNEAAGGLIETTPTGWRLRRGVVGRAVMPDGASSVTDAVEDGLRR